MGHSGIKDDLCLCVFVCFNLQTLAWSMNCMVAHGAHMRVVQVCICFHQLLDGGSLVTMGVVTKYSRTSLGIIT